MNYKSVYLVHKDIICLLVGVFMSFFSIETHYYIFYTFYLRFLPVPTSLLISLLLFYEIPHTVKTHNLST